MVGSGTDRDGNGDSECISFPTASSRPLPTLLLAVYSPDIRHLVPVQTVYRRVVRCIPIFFGPTVRPAVPILSRCPHTVCHIPQLTIVADVPIPFLLSVAYFPPHVTMDAIIRDATCQ